MFEVKEILVGMAPYTHYVAFGLLLLAGFSLPVSEDIVFIISASLAATVVPENIYYIFAGCFLGAFLSDIEAYLIGRYGINKILFSRLLLRSRIVNREKVEQKINTVSTYFLTYGGKTLFFGRFIPFGARNVLFMTCGLIRMKLVRFMIIDFCALCCTSVLLFSLGYSFGNNYERIFPYLNKYKLIIAGLFIVVVVYLILRNKCMKRELSGQNSLKEADSSKKAIIE
jgi:membrane-associated protein